MRRILVLDSQGQLKKEWPSGFNPRFQAEFAWVDLVSPSEEDFRVLLSEFAFHPLAVANCRRTPSRPGLTQFEDYAFLTLECVDRKEGYRLSPSSFAFLNIFVGPNFVVTVHKHELSALDGIWSDYETHPSLASRGTDYLLYRLLQAVTYEFFPFFDALEEKIGEIEEEIFRNPGRKVLNQIFLFRRQIITLRKSLSPQRDAVSLLSHPEFPLVKRENRALFLDVYNEYLRLVDHLETLHELVGSALEIYLSLTSNRLNEVVKILTVVTTVMMPLTVISGIYGMNFRHMPELEWRYGYYWALALMSLLAGGMAAYFRKKGWF